MCWLEFLSPEKRAGASVKELLPQPGPQACLGSLFLISDGCRGRAELAVRGATPGQVVLGCPKEHPEQAPERKPVRWAHPWSLSQFLP